MKLTDEQCRDIKRLVRSGVPQKDLAVEYGVAPSTICKIVQRTRVESLTSDDFELKPPPPPKPQTFELPPMPQLGEKPQRWLIIPDLQIPYHDVSSLLAVLKYAQTQYWDGCIQLGDFMDWEWCSKWTKDNQRAVEGARFLAEYITGNQVLDAIEIAVRKKNPKAQITILEGNHDWRVENVIDKTPSLEGLIEMERGLRLKERNITYWKYWTHRRPYIIGNAYFIHGEYIGANHAKKTAESFHRNVFYGHTHDRQSYTKTTAYGDSVECASLGTLSRFDLSYMGHKPSAWMQCFAEFFFRPDGNFNHYVTNVIDHSFTALDGSFWKE